MSQNKFPNYLDLNRLQLEFSSPPSFDTLPLETVQHQQQAEVSLELQDSEHATDHPQPQQTLTGTRLRSYAFAVLTRREYSKTELIEKLMLRALSREEVVELVEEFAQANYQSDERVAEMTIRSQVRQGKGPYRIQQRLKSKNIEKVNASSELKEIDWHEHAYQLKVKKFGIDVAKEAKVKAKQIRFLQYRGFEMDSIMKAIQRKPRE